MQQLRLIQSSKDPFPPCTDTFSHLIYTDLRDDKIGSELAKISQLAAQSHPCHDLINRVQAALCSGTRH